MENFWDFSVWGGLVLVGTLLGSMLLGNAIKKATPGLRSSLIPTSVIGGMILLVISEIYHACTGKVMYNTQLFGGNGSALLEILTYHCLALGFIASTFKSSGAKLGKERTKEIFNTGVTTVSTYLLQAIVGMGITFIAARIMSGFFPVAGILLPFGYGQGTGQAMNYGQIYENQYGFVGGKSFGLTIAALGFLSASIGGVIYLNVKKRRGTLKIASGKRETYKAEDIQSENEIPMQESIDKMTIQVALVIFAYLIAYLIIYILGTLLPGMKAVLYGFNFLFGVLAAVMVKFALNNLRKAKAMKHKYVNDFLMTRVSNFFFDVMVVAGIAAIRLDILENYWGLIIILACAGMLITFFYERLVAKTLFRSYYEEQFLMMYGMLTGTASTGIILLREIDGEFKTPAADNMVYQNFPAIVFGFPMMILATLAPDKPWLAYAIFVGFFIVMNIILFRSFIFRRSQNDPKDHK
ncbi:MAG: hypothetical protein K6G69_07655 [Lachnospiraceae bacterium]|nr:hypothetical protein [Lachnospiraceae bacterium]